MKISAVHRHALVNEAGPGFQLPVGRLRSEGFQAGPQRVDQPLQEGLVLLAGDGILPRDPRDDADAGADAGIISRDDAGREGDRGLPPPFRVTIVAAVAVLDRIAAVRLLEAAPGAPSASFALVDSGAADDDTTLSVTLLVEQQAIRSTIVESIPS